ncbi:sigma factor G inhibitor Gin [Bacillus sp. DX1.1]|uniref:sigma factor G inhibitor Gin n=1 Tax=unclassified Bacillus (in: firmicutes) TaxID=185979 RepID=UPI002570B533|nr:MULTISPECIES: sigma factor G inhibitor Gin [unclassified Bacillus (in: firmicutes)]MDM5152851.1 sigma factor G inhibitor Gin [Bacillus sp. DX1.1]WJE81832.1 sigma factor G inhibitor Gin [Bacillus sp. DX3.1]
MNIDEKVCIVCEHKKDDGIHLYTSFICEACERDMVETETNDPKYIYFLQQLRKIQTLYS